MAQILVKHFNKDLKLSPRKFRLLLDEIKKLTPAEALIRLPFVNHRGARAMVNEIKNAIANAKNNFGLNPETLVFHSLFADEGQKLKRMDKSHGSRFARGVIIKRHSRLTIILAGEKVGEEKVEAPKAVESKDSKKSKSSALGAGREAKQTKVKNLKISAKG